MVNEVAESGPKLTAVAALNPEPVMVTTPPVVGTAVGDTDDTDGVGPVLITLNSTGAEVPHADSTATVCTPGVRPTTSTTTLDELASLNDRDAPSMRTLVARSPVPPTSRVFVPPTTGAGFRLVTCGDKS